MRTIQHLKLYTPLLIQGIKAFIDIALFINIFSALKLIEGLKWV